MYLEIKKNKGENKYKLTKIRNNLRLNWNFIKRGVLMIRIENNNVAITRDGCMYLYKLLNGEYQMYGLSGAPTKEYQRYWDTNLLARRDGPWEWLADKPRDKDIIYLFEITDEIKFLDIIREIKYMKYNDLFHYTDAKFCNLIFERIDGVMEPHESKKRHV
mgnify:FL=1